MKSNSMNETFVYPYNKYKSPRQSVFVWIGIVNSIHYHGYSNSSISIKSFEIWSYKFFALIDKVL